MNGAPVWVPVSRPRTTTLSPSAMTSSSTDTWSGKASRCVLAACLMPCDPSTSIDSLLWLSYASAISASATP